MKLPATSFVPRTKITKTKHSSRNFMTSVPVTGYHCDSKYQ